MDNVPKRVHELAKELNVTTKELINIMEKQNIQNTKEIKKEIISKHINHIPFFLNK